MREVMKTLCVILLGVLLSVGSATPAAASGGQCVDLLSLQDGGKAGDWTVERLHDEYPTIGITKNRGVYSVSGSTSATSVTFPELISVLSNGLRGSHHTDAPLQLYFRGVDPGDAWNIVNSLRIKSGADKRTVEAIALGGGGYSKPPWAGTSPVAGRDGEPPAPPSRGKGSNGSGRSNFWLVPPFKDLSKRYNWNKAEILEEQGTTPARLSEDLDESAYEYVVRVPRSNTERAVSLSVVVFFQKLMKRPRPPVSQVADSIRSEVRKESLRRATVQRAARRIIDRIESDFDGAKARAEISDLMIVELHKAQHAQIRV